MGISKIKMDDKDLAEIRSRDPEPVSTKKVEISSLPENNRSRLLCFVSETAYTEDDRLKGGARNNKDIPGKYLV